MLTKKQFDQEVSRLYGYLNRIAHQFCSAEDVDDVVQEACLYVWEHREDLGTVPLDKALINRTKQRAIDQVRKGKVLHTYRPSPAHRDPGDETVEYTAEDYYSYHERVEQETKIDPWDRRTRTPEEEAMNDEEIGVLVEVLSACPDLSTAEVRAIELLYVQGYTTREAGNRLKMSHVAVKLAADRGLSKLREYAAARGLL